MPYEIQPLGESPIADQPKYSPSWDWAMRQPYNRDATEFQANNEYRPGAIRGGPSSSTYDLLADPNKYRIFAPAPQITDAAATQQKAFGRLGTVSLDMIDPFMTIQSIAQGIGFSQDEASGAARGAQTFLGERDIDPFGQGAAGVPSRLFDYAGGLLGALYDQTTGKPITVPQPIADSALQYNFQRDQGYWALVGAPGATDEVLAGMARQVAGQYTSGDNAYLAEKLLAQFKIDRDRALGISSGDRRVDWQAKLAFQRDYIAEHTGGITAEQAKAQGLNYMQFQLRTSSEQNLAAAMLLPAAITEALPFVGADIAERAYQVPKQVEDAWSQLTTQQRQAYFGQAGATMLLGDVAVWLPLMSGIGAVEATAARSGGVAHQAFKAWEFTRNVTTGVMAAGLTTAVVNWGLEAAVPGYAEGLGKRIDYARPVSSSVLAGLVNQVGFFSSGTFGASTAARLVGRVGEKIVSLSPVRPGLPELSYFRNVFGGSERRLELVGTGLPDPGLLDLAPKAQLISFMQQWSEADRRQVYEAIARGHPSFSHLDELGPEARMEAANELLLHGMDQSGAVAEGLVKAWAEARRPRPIWAGENQRMHDEAVKLGRYVDDEMARLHSTEYGQAWVTRRAGAYTSAAMERYARAAVDRLGGDGSKLAAHDESGWAQTMRYLHAYEFHKNAGLLEAAAEGAEEAPRLTLMQADHLFANDVEGILTKLRGDDPALAQAAAADVIRTKREADEWFAREWTPEAGVPRAPENVPPAELADWLEEIRVGLPSRRSAGVSGANADLPLNAFQAEMEKDGLWTLGFKPTDEAGNAISYVKRRNGTVFKSPWIDYPLGSNESIELGNRGLVLSKIDGITRGYRTWRIVEFQKGLLYRRLTGRLDVSAEQIERFHAGLMQLARRTGSQVQTLGAISRATSPIFGKELIQEKIDALVADVFGPGPFRDRVTGEALDVNWYDEIAKSYRQSFRLNLTAGLTSFLKANLGEVGSQIAWASDIGYVAWRFNLSPIFKGGELVESWQLNAMRGVRDIDPLTRALYLRAGVGNDFSALGAELPFDPLLQGAAGSKPTYVNEDPSARFAASQAFYARHLPEDFKAKTRMAFEQQAAADMRAAHGGGGQMPSAGWLPKPTGRVVTPDAIPEGYTTELGDIFPELLDPDQLAADQGIWHATTKLERVYDEGLKSAREVDKRAGSPAPRMGEGFKAWRARTEPATPGSSSVLYRHLSAAEFKHAEAAGQFEHTPVTYMGLGGKVFKNQMDLTSEPDKLLDAKEGYIVEFDAALVKAYGPDMPGGWTDVGSIDWGAQNRTWKWNRDTGDFDMNYESLYAQPADAYNVGLGGGMGRMISTTHRWDHASAIAERLRVAVRAARNEISNAEILDHFADWYGEDWAKMGDILGHHGQPDYDALVAWMDQTSRYSTGSAKYRAVQDLDGGLPQSNDSGEFGGGVLLVGSPDGMRANNPDDIGVVRLAVDKSYRPSPGADSFELEYPSNKLFVVDERQALGPLADDEQGLLEQLKATLADKPKEGQLTVADYMVGGNGIAPGLEGRARVILTKLEDLQGAKLDGGPTFAWDELNGARATAFNEQLKADGWKANNSVPGVEAWQRTRLDGTTEVRKVEDLYDEYQRRPGAAGSLDEVAGTSEAVFERFLPDEAPAQAAAAKGWRKDAWDTFWHPAKWKLDQAARLQIKLAREALPSWLKLTGNDAVAEVIRSIPGDAFRGGVNRTDRWMDWLVEDRVKLAKWFESSDPADLEALIGHAGTEANRESLNEFYGSEEWASLSALIGANLKSASQESFGVHFFSPYRSPLERSINHPLLGLYPASWSIKVAREWAKFLYDNKTLGINLGMAPAQAIASIVHAQHAAFAQLNDQDLDTWLQNGPLGSPLFIFNLLLPGDWSALPFAMSRTIRDYARPAAAGDPLPDAGEVFANNLRTIGLTRDARLFFESIGQIGDLLHGQGEAATPKRVARRWSVKGGESLTYDAPMP